LGQLRSHFFRQIIGLAQDKQDFSGKNAFFMARPFLLFKAAYLQRLP